VPVPHSIGATRPLGSSLIGRTGSESRGRSGWQPHVDRGLGEAARRRHSRIPAAKDRRKYARGAGFVGSTQPPSEPKKQKRCDYPIEPTSNLFFGSTLDSLVGNWVTQNNLVQGLAQQLTIKLIQLWDSPINRTEQSSQCSQLDKGNIAIDMDK